MALNEFTSQIRHAYSTYGVATGSRLTLQKGVERILARAGSKINYGFRPLDQDWDVMVVLDACRFDLFQEFAQKHPIYKRFDTVSSKFSCASTSREWFQKGFGSTSTDDVSDVHYVTQNPYLSKLDLSRFHAVEQLWEVKGKNASGSLKPSTVTDIALRVYDSTEADRFIVHYLPPHAPFLHCIGKYDLKNKSWGGASHDVWFGLQVNEFDEDEVWRDYGQNLLIVLDEVQRLAKHLSGNIVVTADHANAMGELGVYGHPGYVPLPAVKKVPWAEITGDGQEYDIEELQTLDSVAKDQDGIQSRLEALGYV